MLLLIEERTGTTPQALLDRPHLPQELHYFLEAFYTLHASRPSSGMGSPGPIPISEILAYCQFFAVDDQEDRRIFLKFMQRLDSAYMGILSKHQEQESKKSKNVKK